VRIGSWLLREACRQAAAWNARPDAPPVVVSATVAGVQFRRAELVRELREVLVESGLPAKCLLLEATEETLLSRHEGADSTFAGLEALGVGVVLDRFGSGDGAVAALRRHPLHAVSLDASLVPSVEGASAATSLVPGIVHVASALGLPVGARGVETLSQANALRDAGCVFGQGPVFSEALDAAAAEAILAPSRSPNPPLRLRAG
jgi:EAL domain-containing protein (putative c-di-GMP-specific phosphodiesterase class I)